MTHKRCFIIVCGLLLGSCVSEDRGRTFLERSYDAHGAANLSRAEMEFTFRGDRYLARRLDGVFSYARTYEDSIGAVVDRLTNDGVSRERNGVLQTIDERTASAILEKVNSVVYFASLPLPLKDPAVIPRYLGTSDLNGQTYHEVEVTFTQEEGGPDFRDRFVYWINADLHTIDFMAYYYLTNETGSRFRQFVNPRRVNGFLVVDHLNFSASPDTIGSAVHRFDDLYEAGLIELVSEVKHEDVRIIPLNSD